METYKKIDYYKLSLTIFSHRCTFIERKLKPLKNLVLVKKKEQYLFYSLLHTSSRGFFFFCLRRRPVFMSVERKSSLTTFDFRGFIIV